LLICCRKISGEASRPIQSGEVELPPYVDEDNELVGVQEDELLKLNPEEERAEMEQENELLRIDPNELQHGPNNDDLTPEVLTGNPFMGPSDEIRRKFLQALAEVRK
jgi:hypothetical protein